MKSHFIIYYSISVQIYKNHRVLFDICSLNIQRSQQDCWPSYKVELFIEYSRKADLIVDHSVKPTSVRWISNEASKTADHNIKSNSSLNIQGRQIW